jgi:NADPH2:quinone reductase
MKAYRAHRLAGLEMLAVEEAAAPTPPAGAVSIAVKAAGIHLADFAALAGERAPRPDLPFTPGLEVAGTVASIGAGVKGLKKGQRVAAFVPWGGLAEQALTPAELCVAIPEGVSDTQAASLPVAYAGAILALREKAQLAEGETVLVLGAGGFIGLAAVEAAKQLGAKVIASAGGEDRVSLAGGQGADHLIDTQTEVLADRVKEFTGGKGVNVVFDPVGGDAFEAAALAAANGARLICAGFAGGRMPRVAIGALYARDLTLLMANLPLTVQSHPALARAALVHAVKWAAEGKIHPRIAVQFPFAEARHAFDYAKSRRGNGAIVVTFG